MNKGKNKYWLFLEDYLTLFPDKKDLIDLISKLMEENPVYSRREAIKYLKMNPSNAFKWRQRGWLKGQKLKSHPSSTFYTKEDLENAKKTAKEYIEKNNLNPNNPLVKLCKRWELSEKDVQEKRKSKP